MKHLIAAPALLGAALLFLPLARTVADPRPLVWQEGMLVSRKTVMVDHSTLQRRYLYRVQSSVARYLVVSRVPISLNLDSPTRFAVDGKHLLIIDAAGRECKTDILPGPSNRFRR